MFLAILALLCSSGTGTFGAAVNLRFRWVVVERKGVWALKAAPFQWRFSWLVYSIVGVETSFAKVGQGCCAHGCVIAVEIWIVRPA